MVGGRSIFLVAVRTVELVLVDHHQQMTRVGEPRKAGWVGGVGARHQALDDAVAAACHIRNQGRQRPRLDAERREAVGGCLDIALRVDEGDEMPGLRKTADGSAGDLAGAARAGLGRRYREQDCLLAIRHRHGAGQEADGAAHHAGSQPHRDGAVAADVRKTAGRHDLPPGDQRQLRRGADNGFDIRITERRRSRTVRPDHLFEIGRQNRQRIARGKALAHRVEHCDVEEGVVFRRHVLADPPERAFSVNALLIKAHGPEVHKPRLASVEISGLLVNGPMADAQWLTYGNIFMVRCNKDVAMHKKTVILPPYMNETAFCQSRYPEKVGKCPRPLPRPPQRPSKTSNSRASTLPRPPTRSAPSPRRAWSSRRKPTPS
ncbi:hypothetical protein MPL1032_30022 [Mesorhizobium plurifarium]|uniref:Uncharacterized protein n=1 Tax=Mesorhizobium plurifarium TaxID=69974 RepID=A0A0K2W2G6_MESPL|nr:hypothetical protein MPL1032_30022 [Mesorhizobium plurifarium]